MSAGVAVLLGMAASACTVRTAPEPTPASADCRTAIRAEDGRRAQLTWSPPADDADRVALDEWCAAVGPAVVASGAGSPAAAVDSLLVITWNSYMGGGNLPRFVADLRRGAHTGGVPVEHFVLLLQEAHRTGRVPDALPPGARHARRVAPRPDSGERTDIVAAARALSLDLVYVPGVRTGGPGSGAPEDRGTAILSTLPLHDPGAIELPHERHRRVVATAEVRGRDAAGRDWKLDVASAHLDNRSRVARPLATFGAARLRQAVALEAALRESASIVLGADLNSWSFEALEEAPRYLHRHFPGATADGGPTFSAGGLVHRRLDYLLFRLTSATATDPVTIPERYGSDHHPVMSWVRVRGTE